MRAIKSAGLQEALDWLETHADDPSIDDPIEVDKGEEQEGSELASNCLVCNDCGKKFTSVAFAQLHASKSGHEDFAESTEAIPQLTEEQKKQRLAELKEKLAEKRQMDAVKAQEQEKQNELIRRKATKETAEMRREMEEKEMKKAYEQRVREKGEEKAERARIKAQIEEDRRRMKEKAEAEKMRAQGLEPAAPPAPAPLHFEPSTAHTDSVRLQIRLPTGKAVRETVASDMNLNGLMEIVEQKSGLPASDHMLMFTLPQRDFDCAIDGEKTLQELGLCPSASLVLRKK